MNKKLFLLIAGIVMLTTGSISAYEAQRGPTGLIYHDSEHAYEGFTLYAPLMSTTVYLINMEGEVVHKWRLVDGVYFWAQLLENGNLLVPSRNGLIREYDWDSNVVVQVASDHPAGEAVAGSGGSATLDRHVKQHHDVRKIWNKKLGAYTYIFVTYNTYTEAEVLARGADPARNVMVTYTNFATQKEETKRKYAGVDICGIAEVDMSGNLIWKWDFFGHTTYNDTDYDASADFQPGYTTANTAYSEMGKIDVNWSVTDNPKEITSVQDDWNHANSLDYNEETGHAIINAKHMSEIYVIDHQGTFVANNPQQSIANAAGNGGDFLYRFGNPTVYAKNARKPYNDYAADDTRWPGHLYNGHQQIWGAHDIHFARTDMIHAVGGNINATTAPAGISSTMWADRGNMMIFDNGVYLPGDTLSSALEWNPFIADATGTISPNYVDPQVAGFPETTYNLSGASSHRVMNYSSQIVWRYSSKEPHSFYSAHISGLQRLPNGNTLICSGARGHIFEVAYIDHTTMGYTGPVTTKQWRSVWEFINPEGGGTMNDEVTDGDAYSIFRAQRYSPNHPAFAGKALVPVGPVAEQSGPPQGFGFGGVTTGSGGGKGSGGSGDAGGGGGY